MMRFAALIFPVLMHISVSTVYANEIDYTTTFSITSYENILRIENPQSDELAKSVSVGAEWSENTINFIASVNAGIEVTRFSNEVEGDRNDGSLNANLLWILSPNRYEWVLSDIYTQTAIDPRLPESPLNRQYINALSTGPNFKWRLAKTTHIELFPRIEDYRFENKLLNNQRANTRLEWFQTPSVSTQYGADIFYETINYTSSQLQESDYEQMEFNLNFSNVRKNHSIEASSGITRIETTGYQSDNETQYRLYVNNQRTRTSSITFSVGKTVTDTSRTVIESTVDSSIALTTSSDIFTNEYITLGYDKNYRSFDINFEVEKREEDYFTQDFLDRNAESASLGVQWNNTNNSLFRLNLIATDYDYPLIANGRIDEDEAASLEYVYRTNSNLIYRISVLDIQRESTAVDESFEDKVMMFSITYETRRRNY